MAFHFLCFVARGFETIDNFQDRFCNPLGGHFLTVIEPKG